MFNVPEKMKLNKYKSCSLPRNKDLFTRVGARVPQSNSTDVVDADYNSRKLDELGRTLNQVQYEQYAAEMAKIDAEREMQRSASVESNQASAT